MIDGSLMFSNAGGNLFYGDPASQYKNAYDSALSLNVQNYNNILKGYQQTMAEQKAAQQQVLGGYDKLSASVMNRLSGANRAAIQSVNDRYTFDQGKASQQLVNRGLGNTTVQQSISRGLGYDRAKAEIDARDRYAQNVANSESQIGLSKLGYQGSTVGQNTSLATKQLDWMDSIKAPYPDAKPYMEIAKMRAQAQPPSYPGFGGFGGGGMPPIIGGGGGGGDVWCFVAGTPIAVIGGDVPIESLRVDGLVLSWDGANLVEAAITALHKRDVAETLEVSLENGTVIVTTDEHPFFRGGEWVPAKDLSVGDDLKLLDGGLVRIAGITKAGPATVYNLSVADHECYFAAGVLVHNKVIVPEDREAENMRFWNGWVVGNGPELAPMPQRVVGGNDAFSPTNPYGSISGMSVPGYGGYSSYNPYADPSYPRYVDPSPYNGAFTPGGYNPYSGGSPNPYAY